MLNQDEWSHICMHLDHASLLQLRAVNRSMRRMVQAFRSHNQSMSLVDRVITPERYGSVPNSFDTLLVGSGKVLLAMDDNQHANRPFDIASTLNMAIGMWTSRSGVPINLACFPSLHTLRLYDLGRMEKETHIRALWSIPRVCIHDTTLIHLFDYHKTCKFTTCESKLEYLELTFCTLYGYRSPFGIRELHMLDTHVHHMQDSVSSDCPRQLMQHACTSPLVQHAYVRKSWQYTTCDVAVSHGLTLYMHFPTTKREPDWLTRLRNTPLQYLRLRNDMLDGRPISLDFCVSHLALSHGSVWTLQRKHQVGKINRVDRVTPDFLFCFRKLDLHQVDLASWPFSWGRLFPYLEELNMSACTHCRGLNHFDSLRTIRLFAEQRWDIHHIHHNPSLLYLYVGSNLWVEEISNNICLSEVHVAEDGAHIESCALPRKHTSHTSLAFFEWCVSPHSKLLFVKE